MPNPGRVRTSAAAPLPSASRALRSFASLARNCSPRAYAHRPTRLAAGWSSTTSPLPPTPSTTACALPPSLTSALAGRALAAALAALRRALVDAAATANLIAHAAALAALAAAAPALGPPLPPPPLQCQSERPRLVSRLVCVYSAGVVGVTFLLVLMINGTHGPTHA